MDTKDLFDQGLKTRKQVLGSEYEGGKGRKRRRMQQLYRRLHGSGVRPRESRRRRQKRRGLAGR